MITSAADAKEFTLSCNKFILVNTKSGEAITYCAGTPSGQKSPHFMREINDEEKGNDTYIATIFDEEKLRFTGKSPSPSHPARTMLESFWPQLQFPGELDGFHIEPYEESSPSPPPTKTHPTRSQAVHASHVDMGRRAKTLQETVNDLSAKCVSLEDRISTIEEMLNATRNSMQI